jgi:hypothetical protein
MTLHGVRSAIEAPHLRRVARERRCRVALGTTSNAALGEPGSGARTGRGLRSASLPILADRRRESIRGLSLTSEALAGG